MRSRRRFVVCGLLLMLAFPAPGAERSDAARALLERAIRAAGGAEKLARYNAIVARGQGKVHALGLALDCTVEGSLQLPGQKRMELDIDALGMRVPYVRVLDGGQGWVAKQGDVQAMDAPLLADAHEDIYFDRLLTLVPLRDKAFTLTALGETRIHGRPAAGLKVSHKGHHDVTLYFDAQTHLLVKGEVQALDPDAGREVLQESYYSDYKEFQGVQRATRRVVYRDGQEFLAVQFSTIEMKEALGRAVFERPH